MSLPASWRKGKCGVWQIYFPAKRYPTRGTYFRNRRFTGETGQHPGQVGRARRRPLPRGLSATRTKGWKGALSEAKRGPVLAPHPSEREHRLNTIKRSHDAQNENWVDSIARTRSTKTLCSILSIESRIPKLGRRRFYPGLPLQNSTTYKKHFRPGPPVNTIKRTRCSTWL